MSRTQHGGEDSAINLSRRSFLVATVATGAFFGFSQVAFALNAFGGASPASASASRPCGSGSTKKALCP
jgi:isoquinoline 1-oxidoreductase beta subunit